MSKLRYVSDIHLEINRQYAVPDFIIGVEGESIILDGDTTAVTYLAKKRTDENGRKLKKSMKTLIEQVKDFDRIFFVLGNHEHYGGHFQNTKIILEDFLYNQCGVSREKYIVLDNTAVELDENTVLLGATLWTDMGGDNENSHYFVGRGMNDFRVITYGDDYFTTYDAVVEHKKTLDWLKEKLEEYKDKRVIVATHHTPSYQSEGRYHANSMITDGYCSNLVQFVLDHPNITDWIHGHTHVNVEYKIGKCRITSNMRGYVDHDWYCKFDAVTFREKFIEY